MKVKEFTNEISVEKEINVWLTKSKNIKIIDIKYSADQHSSNALIIYEEDSESGKQHSKK
jgi:hypothetical protein